MNDGESMDGAAAVKISVIVPIYNHAEYVVECLKSVVDQGDRNFEIVAVDDGSGDDSHRLALQYLSANLAPERWQLSTRENRGINRTMNEGIQGSSGEIIYILASDDRMPRGALQKIRQIYLRESDRCRLFFYDISTIDWNGRPVDQSESSYRPGGATLLGFSRMHLVSQIVLCWGRPFGHQFYSREYYEKYGPYPEQLKYEDLYFAFKAVSLDRFTFVPVPLKEYRLRPNLTNTPGLSETDMDETYRYVRETFTSSVRLRYTVILMLGHLFHCGRSKPAKSAARVLCALVHRAVYWWNSTNLQTKL